jgi:hypothetical protein
MQNSLSLLPASLLERLDAVLPKLTTAAIHGQYLHGVWLVSFGGILILGCLLYGARTRRVEHGALLVSFAGLASVALGLPSVFAPQAVLARELLTGL